MISEMYGSSTLKGGFLQLPNVILHLNKFLNKESALTPSELLVLINIIQYWRFADKPPFPSAAAISENTGLSIKAVYRSVESLASKNLLKITKSSSHPMLKEHNVYDLKDLIEFATLITRVNVNIHPRKIKKVDRGI
jgi:DNA replication protein DnaD